MNIKTGRSADLRGGLLKAVVCYFALSSNSQPYHIIYVGSCRCQQAVVCPPVEIPQIALPRRFAANGNSASRYGIIARMTIKASFFQPFQFQQALYPLFGCGVCFKNRAVAVFRQGNKVGKQAFLLVVYLLQRRGKSFRITGQFNRV